MIAVGEALGDVPHWLNLGPVFGLEGVKVRKVLGDWSHLNECDRPPEYFFDGIVPARRASLHDRSETRPPVEQTLPGKSILELKGRHSGRVAILFNGPSLALHDLNKIACPIIGINRTFTGSKSYSGPEPDYLCVADDVWISHPLVQKHPGLINGTIDKRDIGYRATRNFRMSPFSFDLWRDGYVSPVPCTTGHLALQAAVYMGFTELYCLGLDLSGGHFDGTIGSRHYILADRFHKIQAPLLKDREITVRICGSPGSACKAFGHVGFEAVC